MFQPRVVFPTGDKWDDIIFLITIAIPNVAAVLIAWLALKQSRENARGISAVRRTLNGEADKSAEPHKKVDGPS